VRVKQQSEFFEYSTRSKKRLRGKDKKAMSKERKKGGGEERER